MSQSTLQEKLGIDFGGTIHHKVDEVTTLFPDAIRVIRRLNEDRFRGNVIIVSKVDEAQEIRAKIWLEENDFCARTLIPPENIFFCRGRSDKGPICHREKVTHFIDDRPEVMRWMQFIRERILFQPIPEDVEKFASINGPLIQVNSWVEVEGLLLPVRVESAPTPP